LRHYSVAAHAANDTRLTKEQIKQFLLTAEIIKSKPQAGRHPSLAATLSATALSLTTLSFQPIDEPQIEMKLASGKGRIGFRPILTNNNIAAYRLAETPGPRRHAAGLCRTQSGKARPVRSAGISPTRWTMSSASKRKSNLPIPISGTSRMYRIRVFDELIYDTDPNLTNVLIGEDWTVWRVDFSRAFRTNKDLRVPKTW